MKLVGLMLSVGLILYLTVTLLNRPSKPEESNKNLLDKPAEVRTEVNKALDATEKARKEALDKSK
jgi:hypothetical protein